MPFAMFLIQAVNGIEMVRNRPALRHTPIIVAGNKVDLERKRAVTKLGTVAD